MRRYLAARRIRSTLLGTGLFADPSWDILLDLFAADVEGVGVSITSACIASGTPNSTALLWIGKLTGQKLVERRADPSDGRRTFLRITPAARDAVLTWLDGLHA